MIKLIFFLLLVMVPVVIADTFHVSLVGEGDNIYLTGIQLLSGDDYFINTTPSEYSFVLRSADEVILDGFFVPGDGAFELILPYDEKASSLVINHLGKALLDISLEEYASTCGNKICEPYESFGTCRQDCGSGIRDGFCDMIKDSICDPDCEQKDPDCKTTKTEQPIEAAEAIKKNTTEKKPARIIKNNTRPQPLETSEKENSTSNDTFVIVLLIILIFIAIIVFVKIIHHERSLL